MIYFTDKEIEALFDSMKALESSEQEIDKTELNAMRKKLSQEMTRRYAERSEIKLKKTKKAS
jgi:predicted DNA-binding transcriptional regulator YafY